jgi:hypothetical protein
MTDGERMAALVTTVGMIDAPLTSNTKTEDT